MIFQSILNYDIFQSVVFPSITVCNLNQLEASNLKMLDIYENDEKRQALLNEFVFGIQENVSEVEWVKKSGE